MSTPTQDATQSPEAKLKHLLLAAELERLARLEIQTDELSGRLGDDAALTESVARVIVGVLRDAGVRDHERLSMTLAPLVLASLQEEVRNSRDMIVDALYPITGRLVAAGVRNAFNELLENLNERLDQTVSIDRWKVRSEAWRTGQSEAEILLRRNPPFELEEVLLIHRPTGLPIARVESGEVSSTDTDLVSGMLTAIMAFVRDALGKDDAREVRKISLDDSDLFISTSPAVILAVKARGNPPADLESAIESEFLSFLERWGGQLRDFNGSLHKSEEQELIADLQSRFRTLARQKDRRPRRSPWKAYVALAVVGVSAIAWWGRGYLRDRQIEMAEHRGREIVGEHAALSGYPVTVQYDRDRDMLQVEGLVPNAEARDRVVSAFKARLDTVESDFRLSVLPDPTPALGQMLDSRLTDVRGEFSRVGERLTTLEITLSRHTQRVEALEKIAFHPVQRLRRWTETSVILFAESTTFRDITHARGKLRELADLVGELPASVRIRVIGYTDATGGEAKNYRLSLDRARAVRDELVALGVPETRLISAGRASEKMVGVDTGPDSPNRRVEFEMVSGKAGAADGGQ